MKRLNENLKGKNMKESIVLKCFINGELRKMTVMIGFQDKAVIECGSENEVFRAEISRKSPIPINESEHLKKNEN